MYPSAAQPLQDQLSSRSHVTSSIVLAKSIWHEPYLPPVQMMKDALFFCKDSDTHVMIGGQSNRISQGSYRQIRLAMLVLMQEPLQNKNSMCLLLYC